LIPHITNRMKLNFIIIGLSTKRKTHTQSKKDAEVCLVNFCDCGISHRISSRIWRRSASSFQAGVK